MLVADEVYADESQDRTALTRCLLQAPHLKSLDLEITSSSESPYSSAVLADISRATMPYRLEHFVLEYVCFTERTITELIRPHVATLRRLLLMATWLRPGTWDNWLLNMRTAGLRLDELELWKPSQGATEYYQNSEGWFSASHLAVVAKKGTIVPYLGEEREVTGQARGFVRGWEQWENLFPRRGCRC